ncbi:MAG: hypothetical protein OEM39_08365 [Acidimicrobiia bacterium]|nr:hypothetical protein [Acidimicrobiia bacterium]
MLLPFGAASGPDRSCEATTTDDQEDRIGRHHHVGVVLGLQRVGGTSGPGVRRADGDPHCHLNDDAQAAATAATTAPTVSTTLPERGWLVIHGVGDVNLDGDVIGELRVLGHEHGRSGLVTFA